MKIKEAFKKLDTYNELAELMNGDKMHIYFADILTPGVSYGEKFNTYEDFRKYIRHEYFKEIADEILNSDDWDLNGRKKFYGRGRMMTFELSLSWN
jgi:hypothetical protein